MIFADGDLYERAFDVPSGRIEVLAEIALHDRQIELRHIAVYPAGAERLSLAPADLLRWAHSLVDEIADAGFDELRVTGTRLSGARRGRRVDLTIRLQRNER